MRIRTFKTKNSQKYFFSILTDNNQVLLKSNPFDTKKERDAAKSAAMKAGKNSSNYSKKTNDNGEHFFELVHNGITYGKSDYFSDANATENAIKEIQGLCSAVNNEGNDGGEYATKGKNDDYKPLSFYEKHNGNTIDGFDKFEAEGEFYFTYNVGGNVVLISEGYSSASGRDNGVKSVEKNMVIEARFDRQKHSNGKHYFNLKAGNHQEIATSRWFDGQGALDIVVNRMLGKTTGGGTIESLDNLVAAEDGYQASFDIAAAPIVEGEPKPKKKRKKRTKPKKEKGEKVLLKNGKYPLNNVTWQTFQSGGNKHFYFIFRTEEGKTVMLNSNVRGFLTEEDADAALNKVLHLAPVEGNYEGKTTKNGKYYFYLKDEDGNNIGKSFFFNTVEDMRSTVGLLIGTVGVDVAAQKAEEERAAEALALAAKQKVEEEARLAAEAAAKQKAEEEARLAAEAAAKQKAEEEARLAAEAAAKQKEVGALHLDDYLKCDAYKGDAGFYKFEEGGEYYFAYNSTKGDVMLRSEGYKTVAARDNGIESVLKNSPLDERWFSESVLNDKYHFYYLKAGNHQEIARSCAYKSAAERDAAFGWVRSGDSVIGKGAALVGGTWLTANYLSNQRAEEEKAAALALAAKKQEEEARLAAEAAARKKAEEEKAAALALAAKQKEEEARLAAEAAARKKAEEEKAAALALAAKKQEEEARLAAEAAARKRAEEEKAAALVLAAKKKEEEIQLAKVKAEEDKKKAAIAAAALAATALAAKKKEEETRVAKAEAEKKKAAAALAATNLAATKKKEEKKKVVAAAAAVPPVEEKSGCMKWLLPLLLLLALLALLFWFLKGCDGCNKEKVAPEITKTETTTQPEKVEKEPVVAPKPICPTCQELGYGSGSVACQISDYISNPTSTFPKRFTLDKVSFGRNRVSLDKNSKGQLDDVVKILNGCDVMNVEVFGNMAPGETQAYRGSKEVSLSEKRSKEIYNRLVRKIKGRVTNGGEGDGDNNHAEIVITRK